jgi:NNP family nitrate/nitrite transporter-like MFS transporter
VPALVLAFAVWMLWSAVVVHLPAAGFRYSANQLFWLTALPALCGATLRVFYAFAVPLVGGRRFTALATASLLLPALGIGFAVRDPSTSYAWMLGLALLCGLGGANFAGSMAHLSFFFPPHRLGTVLGLNAGLGHLGVPLVQWLVPVVIGSGLFGALGGAPQGDAAAPLWLQNAGFVWVPLIAASALAAWFGMDDLPGARAGFAEQAVIVTRRHTWLLCWLYLGSFGSFIGFAAGLPMLLQTQFGDTSALLDLGWLGPLTGPLVGALARPLGGWLADRLGGGRVCVWAFAALAAGVLALLACLPGTSEHAAAGSLPGTLAAFGALFAASGIANGASFRMIPSIFATQARRAADPLPGAQARAQHQGQVEAAAALGFASAIGAYGGFFIPKSYGSAIALTGSPAAALPVFFVFYLSCLALAWWHYARPQAPMHC